MLLGFFFKSKKVLDSCPLKSLRYKSLSLGNIKGNNYCYKNGCYYILRNELFLTCWINSVIGEIILFTQKEPMNHKML
jgi:hypothetical protein